MILTGPAIQAAIERGDVEIDPFDPARINPASYDLLLGSQVAIYTAEELDLSDDERVCSDAATAPKGVLDSKKRQNLSCIRMSEDGFTVEPGRLYLMHTAERIHTRRYVPIIDGKSSIGRLGLTVHITAGYGDPGFNGQYTIEVVSLAHAVIVYPGMRFAQVRFHMTYPIPDQLYQGNYTDESAMGPVRSASWCQFETK